MLMREGDFNGTARVQIQKNSQIYIWWDPRSAHDPHRAQHPFEVV